MPALRLDHLLSRFGYCSRREAVAWIKAGRITSKGTILQRPDQKVPPESVEVDGSPVEFPHGLTIVLHKPTGFACSHDPAEAPLIYDLLPPQWMRRNPRPGSVGRLDRDTSGLILITDDGPLSHRLTSPKHGTEKLYEVTVSQPLPPEMEAILASGTLILHNESKPCLPARMERTSSQTARLWLHEGKYHQVRRMFASFGCPVTRLHRSAIGPLTLENLPEGSWRPLHPNELQALQNPTPP